MEDNLIDNELNDSPDNKIMKLIRWWERIRIHNNIVIILLITFVILYDHSIIPSDDS